MKNQLENLANRFKDLQEELTGTKNILEETKAEKDSLRAEKETKEGIVLVSPANGWYFSTFSGFMTLG